MRDLLTWIEQTGLGHMMRESGPWTYAIVNVAHILGVATLFGSVLVLDLRLLGVWSRRVRIADLSAPVMAVKFWKNPPGRASKPASRNACSI